jgi:hypothetical protein
MKFFKKFINPNSRYHFNKNQKANLLNMDRKLISSARKKTIKKIFEENDKIYDVINDDNYL